jgi:hypothetical protein
MNLKSALTDIERGLSNAFHAMMRQEKVSLCVHSSSKNSNSIKTRTEVFLSTLKSSYPSNLDFDCRMG